MSGLLINPLPPPSAPLPRRGKGEQPKIKLLVAIALQLAKAGQTSKAEQVFAQAEQLVRQKLSLWEQDGELGYIAIQLAEAGLTEKALQLTNTLSPDYLKAGTLNGIASQLLQDVFHF